MTAPARVVDTIRPDTVFVPFHWVGANRLTNDALDPASRMPEVKVCACAVTARAAGAVWSKTARLETKLMCAADAAQINGPQETSNIQGNAHRRTKTTSARITLATNRR